MSTENVSFVLTSVNMGRQACVKLLQLYLRSLGGNVRIEARPLVYIYQFISAIYFQIKDVFYSSQVTRVDHQSLIG